MNLLKRLFKREKPVAPVKPLPLSQTIPDIDLKAPVLKVNFYRVTLQTKEYPDLQEEAWEWRN